MAFIDEYPYLNNTTSYIIDDDVDVPPVQPNPNSIIVLGTAQKGPLHKPVLLDDANISSVFGAHVEDPFGDLMLFKGYKEMKSIYPGASIYGVRIGDAQRASLNLYENQITASGDLSATDVTACMRIESKTDGDNTTEVNVIGDASGSPTVLDVALPDGVTLNYQMDVDGDVPGAYYRVSDLVNALNNDADFAAVNQAKVNVLTAEVDVTIVSGIVSGESETTYDLESGAGSYGDKLIEILTAYTASESIDSASIEAGDTTSTLAATPNKDEDPNTETISNLLTIKTAELLLTATAIHIGTATLSLDCIDDSHWDKTDLTYNIVGLEITRVRGGVSEVLTLTTDYTVSSTTGIITLTASNLIALGDKYYADYKYRSIFVEANVRSDLQEGNRYSYFIYGKDIVFGAAQRYNIEARYLANSEYIIGADVIVSDAKNTIVRFVNPDKTPALGDVVRFVIVYEPELPALSGTIISSSIVQETQLTGGSDGRRLIGTKLYDELEKGYQGAENMPARYLIPTGVYLDDTIDSIDFETGLPTVVSAGFLDQASKYAKRKSKYVSECFGIINIRPMVANDINNPTLDEINDWYDKLINVSSTDTTRPANQVATYDDYHMIVPVGDAVFQITGVNNGTPYVGQFAGIHAAIMQNMNPDHAIVNQNINSGPIQRFVYPIMNNEWINKINQMRYTLYTQSSIDGSYTIIDSPTLARSASKFDRQFVTQIVFDIIQTARLVAKPFLGKSGNDTMRKSLETSIRNKIMDQFHPERISGLGVTVYATSADKISGKTQVLLNISTSKEIRKIAFTTSLALV